MADWDSGARIGAELGSQLGGSVGRYYEGKWKGMELKERMKERAETKDLAAQEREANRPYTPDELTDLAKGKTEPLKNRPASHQIAILSSQAKQKESDEKNNIPVTDSTFELFKSAGQTLAPGTTSVSRASHEAALKIALEKGKAPPAGQLSGEGLDNLEWGIQNKLMPADMISFRGPRSQAMADVLGRMRSGKIPKESLTAARIEATAASAKASGIATVQGRVGQTIGATAASMDDMMEQVQPLISKVSPSKFKAINAGLQAGLDQINDPDLATVYTKLTSAAGFYASLQKSGGVPDEVERKAAMKIISFKLNEGGFSAVKKALHDEGTSRVKRIKEKQSETGGGSQAARNSAASPGGQDSRVEVMGPNGVIKHLPASQLNDFLADPEYKGWKKVAK